MQLANLTEATSSFEPWTARRTQLRSTASSGVAPWGEFPARGRILASERGFVATQEGELDLNRVRRPPGTLSQDTPMFL